MDAEHAAWILKNERDTEGRHPEAVATLRALGFVRIIYGAPEDGVWPILSVERADTPADSLTLFRRSTPEHARGLFWCSSYWGALLHTIDRAGLQMFREEIRPADIVAEFVMENSRGARSGGEYIVTLGDDYET